MTLIICPAHQGECGEGVTLDLGGFAATSATVGACSQAAQGVTSYTVRKSEAVGFRRFQADSLVHRTGLVVLG